MRKGSVRLGFFIWITFIFATPLTFGWQTETGRLRAWPPAEGAPRAGQSQLLLSFSDLVVMDLFGCATGSETSFPAFTIDVPPGEDFEFQITRAPASELTNFFIVSKAIADTPGGFDVCNQTDPGVFVDHLPITANDAGTIPTQVIPSALVDQLVTRSNEDGFVVMLSQGCPETVVNFAGVKFTRTPVSGSNLALTLEASPDLVVQGQLVNYRFKLTNNGGESVTGIDFTPLLPANLIQLANLTIDGMPCPLIPSPVCNFELGPGEMGVIDVLVQYQVIGNSALAVSVISDFCEDSASMEIPTFVTPPIADKFVYRASAFFGVDFDTKFRLTNPNGESANIMLSMNDGDGNAYGKAFDDQGVKHVVLSPGATGEYTTSTDENMFSSGTSWVISDQPLQGDSQAELQKGEDELLEALRKAVLLNEVNEDCGSQTDGYRTLTVTVDDPRDKKLYIRNRSAFFPTQFRLYVHQASTGALVTTRKLTLRPYDRYEFPLFEPDLKFTLLAIPCVVMELVECSELVLQSFEALLLPSGGTTPPKRGAPLPFAQPFFQPDPLDPSYETSQLTVNLFPGFDQMVPAGSLDLSFDGTCGVGAEVTDTETFLQGAINAAVSVPLNSQSQAVGGFGFENTGGVLTGLVWEEGSRKYWFPPVQAVTQGRIYMQKINLDKDPDKIAANRFQVYSDTALTLATARFNAEGYLLGMKALDLSPGGHLLCNQDFGLTDDTTYLEFYVPDGHPSPFWFHAFADEPDLKLRTILPLMATDGASGLAEVGNAFASWNGMADACLGPMPDVTQLVAFVNNAFICPAPE